MLYIFLFRSISVSLQFITHDPLFISYLIGAQIYAGQNSSSWKIH